MSLFLHYLINFDKLMASSLEVFKNNKRELKVKLGEISELINTIDDTHEFSKFNTFSI
jgi:hypothetical protein